MHQHFTSAKAGDQSVVVEISLQDTSGRAGRADLSVTFDFPAEDAQKFIGQLQTALVVLKVRSERLKAEREAE